MVIEALHRPCDSGRHEEGFSLFELIVVLVLLALVAAVILPSFTNGMEGIRLNAAARDMVDALTGYTRNEISAELTSLTPDQNPYIIDAMAMIVAAADEASRRSTRNLEVVRIGVGEVPRVSYDGRTLDISVATHLGYGGRPSSEYIRRALDSGSR